jgi:hypothetical protein
MNDIGRSRIGSIGGHCQNEQGESDNEAWQDGHNENS